MECGRSGVALLARVKIPGCLLSRLLLCACPAPVATISLSADVPTLQSGWTKSRRLRNGFVTDGSGFIRQGVWRADGSFDFKPGHTVLVTTNRSLLSMSLLSLGLPLGVKFMAKLFCTTENTVDLGNPAYYVFVTDPDLGAPTNAVQATFFKPAGFFGTTFETRTDTSGRVYTGSLNAADADNVLHVVLHGWSEHLTPFA